jgi:hypothetical protein
MRAALTKYREDEIKRFIPFRHRAYLESLEAKFGKYLFIPLDVPSVDLGQPFADWYAEHSKPVRKVMRDVAGDVYEGGTPTFRSIDVGEAPRMTIWERNVRDDVVTTFPQLQQVIDALPYDSPPPYSLWSSQHRVLPHRDQGCWFDFPCSFDNNTVPTLSIREVPATMEGRYRLKPLPRVRETHTFAWNNLRTTHQSFHVPGYLKILMIVMPAPMNLEKYNDLLERSVHKYLDRAIISSSKQSEFIEAP